VSTREEHILRILREAFPYEITRGLIARSCQILCRRSEVMTCLHSLAEEVPQLTDSRWMLRRRMADGESVHSDRWCRKIEKARSRGPIHFFWKLIFL
jgi:hypothetical protein